MRHNELEQRLELNTDNSRASRRSGLAKFDIVVIVMLGLGGALSLLAGVLGGAVVIGVGAFVILILACVFYTSSAIERQQKIDELPEVRAFQRQRAEEVMRGLAAHHGTTASQNKAGLPSVSLVSGGQPVEVSAAANNMMISMSIPPDRLRLYIYPQEQMKQSGFRKAVDTKIFNKKFDRHFLIQTNDTNRAKQVLTQEVRNEIFGLADLVLPAPMGVALNGNKLKCFVALPAHDDWRSVDQSLAVMREFQMQLGLWNDEEVLRVLPSFEQPDDANCLVCGDTIDRQVVKCRQCQTPVHLECWNYIGNCSVFGCGSKRYEVMN